MNKEGILIVVSGFSGAGKGTIMKALLERYDNYALSISATTRNPRPGEEEGKAYFFKTTEEFEKIKEKVVTEEPKKTEETQKSTVEIPIDFQTLQNMNPDIYAWIKVPGTVIDYPIVQSGTDNSYYLNHSVEHDENKAGAIFTEDYNTKTFEDPNTVIYGHGMANGSMFDGLHQYMDRDFFDQNKEVIIYMSDKILHYQIFAAYLYDNRHLLQSFNFDNKDIYQAYLDMVFGIRDMKSNIDTAASVTADDKIITLSTCYAGMDNRRYLVQAVLVSIEQ